MRWLLRVGYCARQGVALCISSVTICVTRMNSATIGSRGCLCACRILIRGSILAAFPACSHGPSYRTVARLGQFVIRGAAALDQIGFVGGKDNAEGGGVDGL